MIMKSLSYLGYWYLFWYDWKRRFLTILWYNYMYLGVSFSGSQGVVTTPWEDVLGLQKKFSKTRIIGVHTPNSISYTYAC